MRLPWNDGGPLTRERIDFAVPTFKGPVAMRRHRGAAPAPAPTLIYFHGGGWTLLDLDTHDRILREHVAASGWSVVGIDYPLAPETRFPETPALCAEAVAALGEQAPSLGLDAARFVLAGDSSGANLCVALAQMLSERSRPPLGLLLYYAVCGPLENDKDSTDSSFRPFSAEPYQLTPAKMDWFWQNYCPIGALQRHPLASPLSADLSRLPPVLAIVAGNDILREGNRQFVAKLRASGKNVDLIEFAGMPHAFLEAFAFLPESAEGVTLGARWLAQLVSEPV